MFTSPEVAAPSIALLEVQNVMITLLEFHNCDSKEIEIICWNSTPS